MQALRDAMGQISAKNAVVFGISTDTVESHKGFVEKYNLNFPLLADTEGKVAGLYGALMPNGKMANRYTFVIGPDGRITSIDRNVNAQFDRGDAPGKLTSRHGENLGLLLSDWKASVGAPVPSFAVADVAGKTISLLPPGKKAAVIAFMSTRCPASIAYEARLAKLASGPTYKDVAFLTLFPNGFEKGDAVQKQAEAAMAPASAALDTKGVLAKHFGAVTTPTVWLVSAKGTAVYAGAIDDSQREEAVKSSYLKDALDSVLAGKPVATATTHASGCAIHPGVK